MGTRQSWDRFTQAVREAVDIVDLASEYTKLEKRGKRWQGLCPFHQEKTPSFSVDADRGLYHCFGCGVGGDAFKLHMELTGEDFPTALETLARRYGIPIPERRAPDEGERRVIEALDAAAVFFRRQLESSASARRYLERRRVSTELIERFGLGYAPDDWRQLLEALTPRFEVDVLEEAGLVARSQRADRPYDRFRNRLVFPIHSPSGQLVGFGGRTLGEDRAKYINSAETAMFRKKNLLYGLHLARSAIREGRQVLLVEGYFDVIGAVASGVEAAVASMGTSLTAEQVRLLARHADRVVLGYDGDRAGEDACVKALPLLLGAGLEIRRARFPAGQDPDSLRLEEGPEAVAGLVADAPDALELLADRVPPGLSAQPARQAGAAERLTPILRAVEDPVLRYAYARRFAERLEIPPDVLWQRLEQAEERPRPRPAPARQPAARREMLSLEDRVLQLLLATEVEGSELVDPEQLPAEGAFLDEASRALYRIYLELRLEGVEEAVEERLGERLRKGGESGEAVDRLARIVLEETASFSEEDLRQGLDRLTRRWLKRRLRELSRQLTEAERGGDSERFQGLLEEKADLSRRLHQIEPAE